MRKATLCFLLKDNDILLAMKKRGFGKGYWNGVGGKQIDGETIRETVIREAKEEINVIPKKLFKVAVLNFYFPHKPEWNQEVIPYLCTSWEGEPKESEEMKPKWFSKGRLPFSKMWPADIYWIPKVLNGKKVMAEVVFSENNKLTKKKLKIVKSF